MKIKIVPTERRLSRQFKARKVNVAQAEEEFERLIDLSNNKNKGRPISVIVNFDDESGKGVLITSPLSFKQGDTLNLVYLATQMLNERYANASQNLKDDFMNLLYEELVEEEEKPIQQIQMPVSTTMRPVQMILKECVSCGEEIAEAMVYCPYCGQNQSQTVFQEPKIIEEEFPVLEEVESEIQSKEEISEVLPSHLLEDFEQVIQKRRDETVSLIKAQLTEKYASQKSQARTQKEEVLEHQKQQELGRAREAYEAAKKEIEEKYRTELQTALTDIETRTESQLEEELSTRLQKQESNVQQLLVQLSQFLNPYESVNSV